MNVSLVFKVDLRFRSALQFQQFTRGGLVSCVSVASISFFWGIRTASANLISV